MGENRAVPNMATVTASIERSLQNCSLNHQQIISSSSSSSSSINSAVSIGGGGGVESGYGGSATSDSVENHHFSNPLDSMTIELNSEIPLPDYWEQFLDLQTGEQYYINWKTGIKVTEDPRTTTAYGGDFYSEDDSGSYDSEGSLSEISPSSSTEQWSHNQDRHMDDFNVLVVAGCKRCLMYYMVPKLLEDCPKCCGQLLHF
ncbi:WW/Rsp5/WWP [Abeliophyllum distichum]|uniref:WW/Rsp5/WWP n=1 Tax=Abeliophyllum distichum TaxID=126358 RepID=A0ABD1U424_9LAMI